jgi:hypothetical protein
MKSMTELHVDRTEEPMLTDPDGYAPKRVRWPGLVAVAVLVAAVIGGVVVSDRDSAKRSTGSPDRGSAQAPAPSPQREAPQQQRDNTQLAQPAKPAQPAQP